MVDVLSIAFVLLYHLKISQSILNCLLLLSRALWLPSIFTLRKIEILPHIKSMLCLYLGNIQARYLVSGLFLHIVLNRFVCDTLLKSGHIHIFKRHLNLDFLGVDYTLGK